MKISHATRALAAATAIAGVAGFATSPIAVADDGAPSTHTLGEQAALGDGSVLQGWTVSDLKVSTDTIPYHVRGTLWEATATDEALRGFSTPVVSNLNARAADGETYRVLFQVATPQGVNPSTLPEGGTTTGKVYFDVTGDAPDSVVYNTGGRDLLLWLPAPVVPAAGSASAPGARATAASGASTPALPLTAVPAALPATPAPAAPGTTNGVNAPTAPADIHAAGTPTSTPTDQHLPDSRDIHGTVPAAEGQTPGAPAPATAPTPAVPAPVAPAPAGVAPAPAAAAPAPEVVAPGPAAAVAPAAPAPAVVPNPVVGPTLVVIPAPTAAN